MFGETTISYVKIWNHPIETTIYKWLFGVPGNHEGHVVNGGFFPTNIKKPHLLNPFDIFFSWGTWFEYFLSPPRRPNGLPNFLGTPKGKTILFRKPEKFFNFYFLVIWWGKFHTLKLASRRGFCRDLHFFRQSFLDDPTYCWWKKSCTWETVNSGMTYLSTGAGFLPSTGTLEVSKCTP